VVIVARAPARPSCPLQWILCAEEQAMMGDMSSELGRSLSHRRTREVWTIVSGRMHDDRSPPRSPAESMPRSSGSVAARARRPPKARAPQPSLFSSSDHRLPPPGRRPLVHRRLLPSNPDDTGTPSSLTSELPRTRFAMPAMPTLAVLRGARRSKLLVGAAVVVLVIFGLTLAPLLAMDGLPPPEPFVHRIVRPGAPAKHGPGQPPRRVANASSLLPELPPDFPPPESLRHPSKFEHFTEAPRSQTPVVNAFPAKLLGAIRPDEWTGRAAPASGKWDPPRGTFAREWVAPEWVSFGPDKPKANDLPRIQFDFPPEAERDADRRQLVAARREVVRNAFLSVGRFAQ
jgi:hypothetical protein